MSKSRKSAQTVAELIDRTTPAAEAKPTVGSRIDQIVREFTERRTTHQTELEKLNAQLLELQTQIDTHGTALRTIDQEQADAIKAAMGEFQLALDFTPAKKTGSVTRMSSDELAKITEKVLGALANEPKSKSTLATETGYDVATVDKALWKLAREGKAETNGIKGKNSGWMKK